ncbi:RICIN domain-containing protein [Streptomyces acidicola]|uniref:RICIN domain-containing protein n=1 Tax=Streptomyces acidicola TaxID=2596892 RepID=UPI002AD423EB|nr:RICIN domain-containing protein [Streptomyces acidicola]
MQDVINTFKNQATGLCMGAYPGNGTGSDYIGVGTGGCGDGVMAYQWNVHQWADGTRELKNTSYGLCLDDSNAYGLRMFPCNATPFQSWYVRRWNDGTIELKNQATGRCLDDSAAYHLRTFPCNATPYQSWY